MGLIKFVERSVQLIPVLLGISLIVFVMITLTPGDPVDIMLGDQLATQEQIDSLRRDMGLDLPAPRRFIRFLANALHGEFGLSFFHRRPVMTVILERLPATIELTVISMLIALLTAVPLGVLAAVKRGSWFDGLATAGSMFGVSMPGFWFGILLIMLFSVFWRILPVSGRIGFEYEVAGLTGFVLLDSLLLWEWGLLGDALRHMIMPAITLGLSMGAILMRVTRTSMLEVLSMDYITFAEAKGLRRTRVLLRHALKNALIPTVTVAAMETGSLLGGNMIVETVFGWPGIGRLMVEGIYARNYPLVQATVLLYAVTYVLLNFVADLLYTVLNPKVRL